MPLLQPLGSSSPSRFAPPSARFIRTGVLAGLVALAMSCTVVPELDATLSETLRQAPYPDLIPLDASLTTPPTPQEDAETLDEALDARIARLQAKAADLNAPIIDEETRRRMEEGVTP